MQIGIGYDIHRLVEGRRLFLGGLEIPYAKGLQGHSDADVLLHAVCDAMLGACAAGDIGECFPDTDPNFKDIPSTKLLERTNSIVKDRGFSVSNLDCIVICDEPKIEPFKDTMRERIASVLEIELGVVNIKATTNEGLGAIGRGEAIAAYAVVLLT